MFSPCPVICPVPTSGGRVHSQTNMWTRRHGRTKPCGRASPCSSGNVPARRAGKSIPGRTWTHSQGRRVHCTHAPAEASDYHGRSLAFFAWLHDTSHHAANQHQPALVGPICDPPRLANSTFLTRSWLWEEKLRCQWTSCLEQLTCWTWVTWMT